MKQYPFFMARITTFGYVAIYFSLLYGRYFTGIVTKDMLELPKSRFAAIGLLEALGVTSGMAAAVMLPGPAIPILSQMFLVWQLVFSVIILGRKYSVNQILGCLLVAVTSGSNDGQMLSQLDLMWPILMIVSSGFQAAASIIKEFVFIDAARRLEGEPLDIFVVNSFGSGFQALFVLLLLPLLSNLWGIPFGELPSYLRDGAACFLNIGAGGGGKFLVFGIQYTFVTIWPSKNTLICCTLLEELVHFQKVLPNIHRMELNCCNDFSNFVSSFFLFADYHFVS